MFSLRKMWILLLIIVSYSDLLHARAPGNSQLPHIVFMVADDLGWNDVNWREPHMYTPNLNHFAQQGIILNNSYVQKVCSPTRSAFMSGYFPYHTGLQHGVIGAKQKAYLPGNLTILPEALKKLGYATHAVGKWHLGFCNWKYTPTFRGFDSFLGYYSAAEDYYAHRHGDGLDSWLNQQPDTADVGRYSAFVYAERAQQLIQTHNKSQPLFLYLPFQSVHTPLQVPVQYENLPGCAQIQKAKRRTKCAMIAALDEAVGNITRQLQNSGYMDNILLIFTTDNGGPVNQAANNWPLRGSKATLWEGGTRGTAFVYSKNLFSRTGSYEGMMHAVDWFPTIMRLVGGSAPPGIDGVSQWEAIVNGSPSPRTEFVYNIDELDKNAAIRMGDWKLIKGNPGEHNDWYPVPGVDTDDGPASDSASLNKFGPNSLQLFNIKDDPTERQDVKDKFPDVFTQIKGRLEEWKRSEVPANFPPPDPASDPKHFGGVWSPGWC